MPRSYFYMVLFGYEIAASVILCLLSARGLGGTDAALLIKKNTIKNKNKVSKNNNK